ncbi:MAG: GvpL/GvpF family gas vesicle protein, partial [Clostridia bacterium]|nr:GvpL/GvpF family gas vesicle protein [Clostridia bacterium]
TAPAPAPAPEPDPAPVAAAAAGARYVYGIGWPAASCDLGPIGLDGAPVYAVSDGTLAALVHACPAEPYDSRDEERVRSWVLAHQAVLERAAETYEVVLPMTFDTIVRDDGNGPDATVRHWLQQNRQELLRKVERLRGRDEYSVQVFWNPRVAAGRLEVDNDRIRSLREMAQGKPAGTAYLLHSQLEAAVREELERLSAAYAREFYDAVRPHCDDVVVEKVKRGDDEDRQMLLNLSCLVRREAVAQLGEVLEAIDRREGFSVRFTGPWPPYSFAS